ncbi:glycosyltransferase family protein [Motiliproteus sp. SC1-56]|uniref:glycosyltransferase family protein n=1 Tax=Motiliproteus sp. SC1-56 TaxID=2799565 RepID=UPI001F5D1665|nr:glycosyltransferase [Motiliproteus sp. SC1-56]
MMADGAPGKLENARVLIYSHDTFGLGHLRRCRTIAHALVDRFKGLSVLILTGSPIIGRFDFKARVDFVRIPGVIKLHNGDYTSLGLHINLDHTLALRESIILHTADVFEPDLFIVDKEPLGLKGEVASTLAMLNARGVPTVLGLRDVLDAPHLLKPEWENKGVLPALGDHYDEIWVYGDPAMGSPLAGLALPPALEEKIVYTGYLPRALPEKLHSRHLTDVPTPFLLITPGGGGDGVEMVDWVLRAYEASAELPWHGLFVLGPFMSLAEREQFHARVERLPHASLITFDDQLECLMDEAVGVVAMGGYNTFCELLSFNKPSLIIPRTRPRQEQLIRAQKAAELGLVCMLDPRAGTSTGRMVEALHALNRCPCPQARMPANFLSGLDSISDRVCRWVDAGSKGGH